MLSALFLLATSVGLQEPSSAPSLDEARARRPNVVLIISDDQDYEHIGFTGYERGHMPNLDTLAEAGTIFTTAHAAMSRCRASLASIITARWPHQHGVTNNRSHRSVKTSTSLVKLLQKSGYETYMGGKMWEPEPKDLGFDSPPRPTRNTFVRANQTHLFAFIDRVAGKRPMFIWWAPMLPHGPFDAHRRYSKDIDPASIPIPDWYEGDPEEYREKEIESFANERRLDEGLGELLQKLMEKGEYENTLFAFLIDNGWANGLPSKGTPFEKGLRTPLFFTWPGRIEAGRRFDDLVSTVDVMPTLLDLVGVEIPWRVPGRSLRPFLDTGEGPAREALYGGVYRNMVRNQREKAEQDLYALYVRTERWKYILYVKKVTRENMEITSVLAPFPDREWGDEDLFDLDADPYELTDLSALEELQELREGLREDVLRWWKRTGGTDLRLP